MPIRRLILAVLGAALVAAPLVVPAGGSRFQLGIRETHTADLAQITSNGCSHSSLTVRGAKVGAECAASLPAGFPDQVIAHCHVDAPEHVDLHVCNLGTPYDPPSATYSVRVFNP